MRANFPSWLINHKRAFHAPSNFKAHLSCRLLSVLLLVVLMGCSHSTEQTDAQLAAADNASDDAKCKALYLVPDTSAYQRCRDQLADQRAQAETSERAGIAGRLLGHQPGQ